MSSPIIFLLGTCPLFLEDLTAMLQKATFPAGCPRRELHGAFACRTEPEHGSLWYWQAIRRYFHDFGLPPIAPVPNARISFESQRFYDKMFAAAIARSAPAGGFIFVDALTALVLPVINQALQILAFQTDFYFLFQHPAKDAHLMRESDGQPPQLTEFIWRNLVTSAVLDGGRAVRFIDLDNLDKPGWNKFFRNLARANSRGAFPPPAPLPAPGEIPRNIQLSPLTLELYSALQGFSAGRGWNELLQTAQKAAERQSEQNGWQFLDCLDTDVMDAAASRLLAPVGEINPVEQNLANSREMDLLALLEEYERRLMETRQEYETRLFLQTQALAAHYQNAIRDNNSLKNNNAGKSPSLTRRIQARRKISPRKHR